MLNPLINSLSPSTKSNGARLDSIRARIIHKIIHNINNSHLELWILKMLNLFVNNRKNTNIIIRATS